MKAEIKSHQISGDGADDVVNFMNRNFSAIALKRGSTWDISITAYGFEVHKGYYIGEDKEAVEDYINSIIYSKKFIQEAIANYASSLSSLSKVAVIKMGEIMTENKEYHFVADIDPIKLSSVMSLAITTTLQTSPIGRHLDFMVEMLKEHEGHEEDEEDEEDEEE